MKLKAKGLEIALWECQSLLKGILSQMAHILYLKFFKIFSWLQINKIRQWLH